MVSLEGSIKLINTTGGDGGTALTQTQDRQEGSVGGRSSGQRVHGEEEIKMLVKTDPPLSRFI